jgi:GNAT superfamily N-acetyltransferase
MRKYECENDYWKIREFLRKIFLKNDRNAYSWQTARLDYWRWHVVGNCQEGTDFSENIFIWENDSKEIIAVLNPENKGESFIQIDPDYKTYELEKEIILIAAKHLKTERNNLGVWAHSDDDLRNNILIELGFEKTDWIESQRKIDFCKNEIPVIKIPGEYKIRSMKDETDLPKRGWASWLAFHSDEPVENYQNDEGEWYKKIIKTPMYRRDLDIVAESKNGEIVAFCTVWFDDVTRTGYFEPIGVMPEHQKKSLGKAVMAYAMQSLKDVGGIAATVAGFSEEANKLYSYMMPEKEKEMYLWIKEVK